MSTIDTVIQRAARRLRWARLLYVLGWALAAAVAVALLALALERLAGLPMGLPWFYGAALGGALITTLVLGGRGGRDRFAVAVAIDQRLGLKDTVATSLYLQQVGTGDDPVREALGRQVQAAAEAATASAAVSQAFPMRLSPVWHYLPPMVALVALLHVFLPALDLFGRQTHQQQLEAARHGEERVREQLVQAKALIEEPRGDGQDLAEADPDALLQELASLSRKELTGPRERGEAAARLSAIQQRLEETAQSQENQLRAMQNNLSQLGTERTGPADTFTDALRRGDFSAAQQALDALADQLAAGQLSDAQRQALEEQMRQLAEQLSAQAQQHQAAQQAAIAQMQQMLQETGVGEAEAGQLAQQLASGQLSAQQLASQLQSQHGMSAQQAQQLAQQLQQLQQQAQQAGHCAACSGGMASAMGQMSQGLSQGQGIGQGAYAAQQQLQQMAQMQHQLRQMQQAQGQVQQAMQGLSGQPTGGAGSSGRQAGTGAGGPLLAPPPPTGPYQTVQVRDVQDREGRIIASWMQEGGAVAGPSQVGFDTAIQEARTEAERAVTDDRVPRRYHEHIRSYFQQLPEDPGQVRQPPPAPR